MDIQYKTFAFKADTGLTETNTFSGYASAFNIADAMGEIVMPGAFKNTLPDFLDSGIVCWQHDWSTPIGRPVEAREDSTGLYVKAKVSETDAGREAMTLMRDGVIRRMSIGYKVNGYRVLSEQEAIELLGKDGYITAMRDVPPWSEGLTALTDLTLFEFSPVSVPANRSAVITAVKDTTGSGVPLHVSVDALKRQSAELATRYAQMIEQRTKDGRVLSAANRLYLLETRDALSAVVERLTKLYDDTAPVEKDAPMDAELFNAYRDHVALRQQVVLIN
jgi:HK97 family phage prohead protease